MKSKKHQKAFTLIELLVVISIIGLLSSMTIVSVNSARMKARDMKRMNDIKAIADAVEIYNIDVGHYPEIGSTPGGRFLCGVLIPGTGITQCYSINWVHNGITYLDQIPIPPSHANSYGDLYIDAYRYMAVSDLSIACIWGILEKPSSNYSGPNNEGSVFWCELGSCHESSLYGSAGIFCTKTTGH